MKEHRLEEESILKLFFVYAVPAMIGVGVFSLYSFVDAVFVAKACGNAALAAVELCAPVLGVFSCFSVIIGVGGNTLVGIELGRQNRKRVGELFSMASAVILCLSLVFALTIVLFTKPIARVLGADESVIGYVCDYLSLCGWFAPFYLVGGLWGMSTETAGRPAFAMVGNVIMALGNIALDYLFVMVLDLGVWGASFASGLSALLAASVFFVGFAGKSSSLKLRSFSFDFKAVKQMIYNGFSDGVSVVSGGIVSFIYNTIIMKSGGSEALACYTVTLTIINFVGTVLIGAAQGINPIVSVNFGAGRADRIKKALKIFLLIETALTAVVVTVFIALNSNIVALFDIDNGELTRQISMAYAPVLMLTPWCAIIISFFTALNDAKTSAILSVLRSLVIKTAVVLAAYYIFGLGGVWYACTVTEVISLVICVYALRHKGIPQNIVKIHSSQEEMQCP